MREQWASIAERAPDNATADYLHQVFASTALAIDGLERPSPGSACTFLYDNPAARDLISAAIARTATRRQHDQADRDAQAEAS
jgi:hypothetical protein